ncbi:MAG: NUDIX hydrolase [Paracoccaceae bacterium]
MTLRRPVLGAIAVVVRNDRVILVKRGKAPSEGMWGFPGGHVELGETALDAAVRELLEETGVHAAPISYLTNIDVINHDKTGEVARHYLLTAVLCRHLAGDPIAQDDAADARWIAIDDLKTCGLLLLDQVAEVAELARGFRPDTAKIDADIT